MKTCAICGGSMEHRATQAKHCSDRCRERARSQSRKARRKRRDCKTIAQKAAATRLNIPFAEYKASIEAGLMWCRACREWHPATEEYFFPSSLRRGDACRKATTRRVLAAYRRRRAEADNLLERKRVEIQRQREQRRNDGVSAPRACWLRSGF